MEYLRSLPPKGVKMCQCHLIYAGSRSDIGMAVSVLKAMQEQNLTFFLNSKDYWDSLYKLDIDINSYMAFLSGYDWMEMARKLWMQVSIDVCEKAYLCLIRGLEKTDVKYTFISALMMEKRLFVNIAPEQEKSALEVGNTDVSILPAATEGGEKAEDTETSAMPETAKGEDTTKPAQEASLTARKPQPAWMSLTAEELWDKLDQLSQYWVSCAAALYREEVFVTDLFRNLPSAYQFGWYIMQANAVKSQNTNLFLIKVADAAKAYPAMRELCKKVITGHKEGA